MGGIWVALVLSVSAWFEKVGAIVDEDGVMKFPNDLQVQPSWGWTIWNSCGAYGGKIRETQI